MLASEPVKRYMTSVVLSVEVDAPAGDILRLFAQYPVHHLPVLKGTRVVGMLSSADVLKLNVFLPRHRNVDATEYLSRRVRIDQVMRQPAITIAEDESMERACRLMTENGIHALPVITVAQDLIGIITSTDIIHLALFPERFGSTQTGTRIQDAAVRMTPGHLGEALQLAEGAVDSSDDRGKIARALIQTQARLKLLENVVVAAERYVGAGQDERLHSMLVKAIDRVRHGSS